MKPIRAIVFDPFGTLIRYTVRPAPYGRLVDATGRSVDRLTSMSCGSQAMRKNLMTNVCRRSSAPSVWFFSMASRTYGPEGAHPLDPPQRPGRAVRVDPLHRAGRSAVTSTFNLTHFSNFKLTHLS